MDNHIKTNQLQLTEGKVKGFSGGNLLDLPNGGLKKIKIAAFATYPTHLHPNKTEYIYVLEGNSTITIGEHTYTGEKDDFFTLPANIEHSITNSSLNECLLLVGSINS